MQVDAGVVCLNFGKISQATWEDHTLPFQSTTLMFILRQAQSQKLYRLYFSYTPLQHGKVNMTSLILILARRGRFREIEVTVSKSHNTASGSTSKWADTWAVQNSKKSPDFLQKPPNWPPASIHGPPVPTASTDSLHGLCKI